MGPPPNNCVHRLRSSLLKPAEAEQFFTPGLVLTFELKEARSRVERARSLLSGEGLSAATARSRFPLPAGRWLCRPYLDGQVHDDTPEEEIGILGGFAFTKDDGFRPPEMHPLHSALLLGFCGPSFYSADRPLIWSEARLSRRLVLYRATNFYDELP
jgi:hypothetical protein